MRNLYQKVSEGSGIDIDRKNLAVQRTLFIYIWDLPAQEQEDGEGQSDKLGLIFRKPPTHHPPYIKRL